MILALSVKMKLWNVHLLTGIEQRPKVCKWLLLCEWWSHRPIASLFALLKNITFFIKYPFLSLILYYYNYMYVTSWEGIVTLNRYTTVVCTWVHLWLWWCNPVSPYHRNAKWTQIYTSRIAPTPNSCTLYSVMVWYNVNLLQATLKLELNWETTTTMVVERKWIMKPQRASIE